MVGGDILETGHSAHGSRFHGDSHIDQVLCEGYRFRIARDGDGSVHVAARLAILAVGDANHGATELSDLSNFRASFANDAAYQLIGNGHFVSLL